MKFLQNAFDKIKPNFEKGGKWEKLHPLYDGHRTIFFSPDSVTSGTGVQVRDAMDLKRLMMTVIIAMVPCLLFGIWNTGYQHHLATGQAPEILDQILVGLWVTIPILIVSYGVGLSIEFTFCVIKGHPISEGFLVTGMLIPLVMPATIPLWQVGLATAFAVIIGKEAFGGTGMNILNVALTARAFLYFAYPSQISGEVWTYMGGAPAVDGYSGATPLAVGAEAIEASGGMNMVQMLADKTKDFAPGLYDTWHLIMGHYPGSIGATSV
ncbi:MAG: RnfABCDGE type electron transport complex subunit D, partial [bacterium]|nr:RnfABCDGE type electron transport complex subunit D [bacterium]